MNYFAQGLVLGIYVASTIGVSGALCLQNMMIGQLAVGLASALAAALADGVCGTIVIFGLQTVQPILASFKTALTLIVGIFLCILGLRRLFEKMDLKPTHEGSKTALFAFASVFFLALVDPVSIMDFMALCLGLALDFSVASQAILFISGLFVGSAVWWFFLCCLTILLRQRLPVQALQWIQHLVGAAIFGLGLWTILDLWRS